jgi:hypothetical protein
MQSTQQRKNSRNTEENPEEFIVDKAEGEKKL